LYKWSRYTYIDSGYYVGSRDLLCTHQVKFSPHIMLFRNSTRGVQTNWNRYFRHKIKYSENLVRVVVLTHTHAKTGTRYFNKPRTICMRVDDNIVFRLHGVIPYSHHTVLIRFIVPANLCSTGYGEFKNNRLMYLPDCDFTSENFLKKYISSR